MRRVIVRYKVKPERAADNEELVRGVYAEPEETKPAGLRYATFKLDDGISFVHLAEHDGEPPRLRDRGGHRLSRREPVRALRPARATPGPSYGLVPDPNAYRQNSRMSGGGVGLVICTCVSRTPTVLLDDTTCADVPVPPTQP
jgi:hypothetical protein